MKKLYSIVLVLFFCSGLFAQKNQSSGVIIATEFHKTRPIREIFAEHPVDESKIIKNEEEEERESEDRENRKPQKFRFSPKDGIQYGNAETTMQKEMGEVPSLPVRTNIAGQTAGGFRPFDPSGAVGPNHFVQMINSTTFKVYNKTTNAVMLTATLGNLWSPATANAGDPIVMYDKAANRWFLAQFGNGSDKKIYIAVSQTGDPTGSYYTYTFVSPQFPDYLKFSVWADGYYMTSNQSTQKVFAFNRAEILAGTPGARSIYVNYSPPKNGFFTPLPGDAADGTLPAVGTPCPLFSYSDNGWGAGYSDAINIYQMSVDWIPTTPTASITLASNLSTASFDASYDAGWNDCSQPGISQKLDGIGGICMYRAQWKSWSGYNSIVLNWGVKISSTQRSIKWCELRQNQSTGAWSLYQEGIYTPDAATRWMGSITMDNNGSIGLSYIKSDATSIFPGLYFTGRRACDPLGTLPVTETVVIAGLGSQTSTNRVGDYSQTTLDMDGVTFWSTSEYMGGFTGAAAARTRIFSYQIAPCPNIASVTILQTEGSNPQCPGASSTFTATPVNGGTSPSYQWKVDAANVGTNSPTFTTSSLSNGQSVTCIMTSNLTGVSGSPDTSNAIIMSLSSVSTPSVSISLTTGSNPGCTATSLAFTATAIDAGTSPMYQWKIDGSNVGINSSVFTSSAITNGQVVTCVVTSSAPCNTSPTASSNGITISSSSTPGISISQTSGTNPLCQGSSVTFTATTTFGGSYPTFQWKIDSTNVGTNNSTFTTSTLTNGQVITCIVTSSLGCLSNPNATSNSITMIVNALPVVTASAVNGCEGDSISLSGSPSGGTYSLLNPYTGPSTTYTYTYTDSNGCSSTSSPAVITVQSADIHAPQTAAACDSYLWVVNGVTYTNSGVKSATFANVNGCDSSYSLDLIIYQSDFHEALTIVACNSYTWSVNSTTYTTSGTKTATFTNASGCDSSFTLNLTINQSSVNAPQTVSACNSYTWSVNGNTYTTSGTKTETYTNTSGCDSSFILNLTINQSSLNAPQTVVACNSYTWAVNGNTYTTSGTKTATYTNTSGCDSSFILNLTINQSSVNAPQTVVACNSYTWAVNGNTYTNSGTKTATYTNTSGCDSSFTLNLTINQSSVNAPQTVVACNSYTWSVNGNTYTNSGIKTATFTSSTDCDSSFILNLTINQSSVNAPQTIFACNSYTWSVNGNTYTTSGTKTATFTNAAGCDSSFILNLTINQSSVNAPQTIVACNSYTWSVNSTTYTTSGTQTATFTNASGCDSSFILNLTINHSSVNAPQTVVACNSYTWSVNATTYTTSGTQTATFTNASGCDSSFILNLTINQSSVNPPQTVTACNSYTWSVNGTTYTTSGTKTATFTNASGCDSSFTLNLTINHSSVNAPQTVVACNSYTWSVNGTTYTTSGTKTATFTNASGCDSSFILNLTINQSSVNAPQTVVACNSYTWAVNGNTYTNSGIKTATFTSSTDCDSSFTLNLTINQSSVNATQTIVACNSYTCAVNSTTYTTSGTKIATFTNAAGCDSSFILNLTIIHSSVNAPQTVVACNSYTWAVNSTMYTTSGTKTATFTNAAGCDSSFTLNLTINQSSVNAPQTISACNSYTWSVNGSTYTTSGTKTATFTNASGCDSSFILNLTINQSSVNASQTVVACNSYTWSVNATTYTTSGTKTATFTNASGCDSSFILNLTINQSSVNASQTIVACNSYTWSVNATTYTTSGTKTATFTNTSGCDSSFILNLTIKQSSTSSSTITATTSYTWSVNSVTYTTSGTYTNTLSNTSGCDSVLTLNLTISTPSGITIAPKVLLAGAYNSSTGIMTDSLRVGNMVPLTEPYSSPPLNFSQLSYSGGETMSSSLLSVTGNNAIIDWIFLELRSPTNPTSVIATKRALLQRDGDVVSYTDGTSPIHFANQTAGSYYVSIKHRNHLGVMTATALSLTSTATTIDFSTDSVWVNTAIANPPRKIEGSLKLLFAGDANTNKAVKYNGSSNDKDVILNVVGSGTPNNTATGYRSEDLNLDTRIKYNGTDNDRLIILTTIGAGTPNAIYSQHTPN